METTIGVGIIGNGLRGRHGYEHFLRAHPSVRLCALAQYPEASPGLLEGCPGAHRPAGARAGAQ